MIKSYGNSVCRRIGPTSLLVQWDVFETISLQKKIKRYWVKKWKWWSLVLKFETFFFPWVSVLIILFYGLICLSFLLISYLTNIHSWLSKEICHVIKFILWVGAHFENFWLVKVWNFCFLGYYVLTLLHLMKFSFFDNFMFHNKISNIFMKFFS